MQVKDNLIFDIGMHKGDIAYPLKKGYEVVTIETNPVRILKCKTFYWFFES